MPVLASTISPPPPRPPPGSFGPRRDWQFVLGPAAGGWDLPLAEATGRTVTWRLTDAHEASFTVNATAGLDTGIVPLATDLHILFAGKAVFRGRIGDSSDQLQGGSHLATFTAQSYRAILERRELYSTSKLDFPADDIYAIVYGLLQQTQGQPGGNLGIGRGLGDPFGQTAAKTCQAGDFIAEKIDDLAFVDIGGFDWDITPHDGGTVHTLDLWPNARGADKNVILQYGDGLTSSNWARQVDTSTFANAARMTGGTPTTGTGPTPVELAVSDIATRPEGRWDAAYQTNELDQARLQARAELQLQAAGLLVPSYTIPLQPGMWGGPDHIWIGDTVHVSLNSGRFTGAPESMRVLELTADLSQESVTVTLSLGQPKPDLRRELKRLTREIRQARKHRVVGRNPRHGWHFIGSP